MNQSIEPPSASSLEADKIQPSLEIQIFSKTFNLLWAGRAIVAQDLVGLSPWELKTLRNAIFARHCRTFDSDMIGGFFNHYPGYKPDPEYNDTRITSNDRANAEVIKAAELQAKRPSADTAWNALRGFLDALSAKDVKYIASLIDPSRQVERVMFSIEDRTKILHTQRLSAASKELNDLCLDDGDNGEACCFMMSALWDLTLSAQHSGGGKFLNEGGSMEVGFTEISGKWWLTRIADTAP